jgi:lipopolysaccharide transport system ATP-binding protein
MKQIVIDFNNVSKKFCSKLQRQMIYGFIDIARNIFDMEINKDHLRRDEFWAVRGVDFQVEKGESFGLVGINGSGKSTVLKMINGIFMPDEGQIKITGSVGALIEVGAGFHPYLTGRENIYLNGAIMGMKKKEIDMRFDDIVNFSGIEAFLDMPVKNYSSGMYVRLGFAIAAHLQRDILLIDEILAVGDISFQQKCIEKIKELKKSGTTILFVSHNEDNLISLCGRCLLIERGKIKKIGPTSEILNLYHQN